MKAITFSLSFIFLLTHQVISIANDDCGTFPDATKELIGVPEEPNTVGTQVDGPTFFTGIVGNYTILKAGGVAPHDPTQGSVELEPGQAVFTFSYCPPQGGCDPGYIFLEDAKTKVFQKMNNGGGATFTIQSLDSGRPVKFTWEVGPDGTIALKNYQYVLPGGAVTTLEHVIKKI